MKLGLITDIHEHVEYLRLALERFESERADQVVVIGDVVDMGHQLEETCRLLWQANAVGVWGNHDFGLCYEPSGSIRAKYPDSVIAYMTSLKPRLEFDGCHFTHVEPWLDPEELADLWYFDGLPDDHHKLSRIFAAAPNRILFAGHFHCWLLASPDGILDWQGLEPVRLNGGRYYVVINALCDGACAMFDTETSELVPYNVAR